MKVLRCLKIKKNDIENAVPLFVIVLEFSTFLNIKLYSQLTNLLPYINLIFILLGICLLGSKVNKKDLSFLGICILYVIPITLINNNSIGALIQYLLVFGTIYYFKNKSISYGFYNSIFVCCILIFIYYTFTAWDAYEKFMTDMRNHVNTNMIAFIVFYSYIMIYLYYTLYHYGSNKQKYLMILFILTVCIIYVVKCRTTLMAILFWGIFNFILPSKLWKSKKRTIILTMCIMLAGCIFPVIYVSLADNSELSEKIFSLTGKYLFTGRELIWKRMFEYIAENKWSLWIGIGSNSEYLFGQGYSLHNSYLGMVLNYGLMGVMLYICYVVFCISSAYRGQEISETKKVLIISYISFLLIGYSEVVIQVSDKVIMVNMLLGLACNKHEMKGYNGKRITANR